MSAARTTRTGVAVSQDRIHINTKPKISAAVDMTNTATANWVLLRLPSVNREERGNRDAKNRTPEPRSQTVNVRPMMPGANRRGARPASSA